MTISAIYHILAALHLYFPNLRRQPVFGIFLLMFFVGIPAIGISFFLIRRKPFCSWSPWTWLAYYVLFNATDVATTWLGVADHGSGANFDMEMNGLVRFLFYKFGFWGGMLIHKGFFILLPLILCWRTKNPHKRASLSYVLVVCAVGLALVSAFNMLALLLS